MRPAERAARKTFFEIYENRLCVRSENDTVRLNSRLIFPGGGFDRDSYYEPIVGDFDPALAADTVECAASGEPKVVHADGLVGSPIGQRLSQVMVLDGAGLIAIAPTSLLVPSFDPASVFYAPTIAAYTAMQRSGKAYLVLKSEDADGARDNRIDAGAARAIADHVDAGGGTPEERWLRTKIMTFYVNRSPFLRRMDPAFVPQAHQAFSTRTLSLNLLADDDDPYDPASGLPPGGPSPTPILRWNLTLRGTDANGSPISVSPLPEPVFTPQITVTVPEALADSLVTIEVQLCDCTSCETLPGSGRCVTDELPIRVPATGVTATTASLIGADASPERVRVRWLLRSGGSARVERRGPKTAWREVGEVQAGGTGEVAYEDRMVEAGARYGYRLVVRVADRDDAAGEVWVDVPRGLLEFALESVRPNPVVGSDLVAQLSLSSKELARLEVLDMSGRRRMVRDLGAIGAGRHTIRLHSDTRIPPGMYLVRLVQGHKAQAVRVAVLD